MADHLRAAIIGCGGFSGAHVRRLRAIEDVEIVSLCSRSEASIDKLVERRLADCPQSFSRYTNPEKMLSAERPDLVIVATPHDLHAEHALLSLEAGAHVLLEKPMVPTTGEARLLARRARELGQVLAVAFNPPYGAGHRRLREILRSNELGRVGVINGVLGQDWKRPTSGSWRHVPEISLGGQLADSGSHLISAVVTSLSGLPGTVTAHVANRGTEVPVDATLLLEYEEGPLVSLAIAGDTNAATTRLTFLGTRGRIEVDGWNGTWLKGACDTPDSSLNGEVIDDASEPDPVHAIIDHLRDGSPLDCDADAGARVTAVIEAARISAASGRPVSITEVWGG